MMQKVWLDTNVGLDYLLKNAGFYENAATIWEAHTAGIITCAISATSLTDIFYIARKHARRSGLDGDKAYQFARSAVEICLDQIEVCPVDVGLVRTAFAFQGSDFEDDVQIASAIQFDCTVIVTRDPKGFISSPINVLSPTEFIEHFLTNGE